MQSILFWTAALTAFSTFIVHAFVGGVRVARPLLADTTLPKASKWLNYYCWHIATVLILAMTAAYADAALRPEGAALAVLMTAIATVLSLLSAAVALKGGIHPLRFPSTSLFTAVAALGAAGLAAA